MSRLSIPATRTERMRAAVAAVNPVGWCYLPEREGYGEDLEHLQALLDHDPELVHAVFGAREYTLLHFAAWGDGAEIAELLLWRGALGDAPARGGATPLAVACTYGHGGGELVELLATDWLTPLNLRIAAALGRSQLIEGFFSPDGSLSPTAGAGREDWAASYEFTARPNSPAEADILADALAYAARNDQLEAARFFLARGVQVDAVAYVAPALHWAALYGQERMVEFLLAAGADVDIQDEEHGANTWDWASFFGHEELARRLRSFSSL